MSYNFRFLNKENFYRNSVWFSLFFMVVALVSVVSAFRVFGIDKDYFSYLNFYNSVSQGYEGRVEIGFVLFSRLLRVFGLDFWWLLFFSAFISLSAKLYLLSRIPYGFFWAVIYFTSIYYLHELTQIRVSMALGFGYLSLYFRYFKKENVISFLLLLISVSFHWTLLFFVPFWLFSKFLTKRNIFFALALAVISPVFIYLSFDLFQYLNPQVGSILKNADQTEANPLSSRNLVSLVLIAIGFLNVKRMPSGVLPFFYLSVSGLAVWYGLMSVPVFAHRIYELTIFSYFLWVSFLPRDFRLISMLMLLVLSGWMFFNMIYHQTLFSSF